MIGGSEGAELLRYRFSEVPDPAVVVAVDVGAIVVEALAVLVGDAVGGGRILDVDLRDVSSQVERADDVPGRPGCHLPATRLSAPHDRSTDLVELYRLRCRDSVRDVVNRGCPGTRGQCWKESDGQHDQQIAGLRHTPSRPLCFQTPAVTKPLATVRDTVKPTSRIPGL